MSIGRSPPLPNKVILASHQLCSPQEKGCSCPGPFLLLQSFPRRRARCFSTRVPLLLRIQCCTSMFLFPPFLTNFFLLRRHGTSLLSLGLSSFPRQRKAFPATARAFRRVRFPLLLVKRRVVSPGSLLGVNGQRITPPLRRTGLFFLKQSIFPVLPRLLLCEQKSFVPISFFLVSAILGGRKSFPAHLAQAPLYLWARSLLASPFADLPL